MRKPRDYDAELKALNDKARQLKTRRTSQLGELVAATGADAMAVEELAGALLAIATTTDPAKREAWRKRGAAFFSGEREAGADSTRQSAHSEPGQSAAQPGGNEPPRSPTGTA
ncbi:MULTISPECIES: conjugal transfer protein TraD [unclassified Novosphingobium]|uniref:conjugal transfer protein TraD n=1 Tax=unclassified Novosphingobium TaxID=2644732 RepID=UPI00135B1091|nr:MULTISPECIES: conjugal transfer protein TraD [unclassified Novosphingobium]